MRITDSWILRHRPPKTRLDPWRAHASTWEEEPDASGALIPTAVVFLTNHECPFRCVMCDLWVKTLDARVPAGAIAHQVRAALATLPAARHVKLYNAGSFFDPQAVPPEDDPQIAAAISGFERLVVESHPAFLAGAYGERCLRLRDRLNGRLEVAIGLETAHPDVLARLNKRMTVDSFLRAARFLTEHDIDLRVFVLVNPPFMAGDESVAWACRSLDLAAEAGAGVSSVIPTRGGNGALEAMGAGFTPPRLAALERVIEYGIAMQRGRVFADLWDIERFFDCDCSAARAERLRRMNRTQQFCAPVECACASRL